MLVTTRTISRSPAKCLARSLATATSHPTATSSSPSSELLPGTTRRQKKSGTIEGVFGGLNGEPVVLPQRFAALKQQLCSNPELFEARWRSVLRELEKEVEIISQKGSEIVPQVSYSDIKKGLSPDQVQEIKKRGVVIVRGGVPTEEALGWKQSILDYIAANKDRVTGAPADRIVFYELYQSHAQLLARAHPALLTTQRALLALWHSSSPSPAEAVGLRTPLAYFDRLRLRPPGPSVFALGPHVDSGGVERWEDPGFRACFARILDPADPDPEGWRAHDPFDCAPRLGAKQDLYNASNQCSVFRPWQGWTALSRTGAREGTLQVLPMLSLAAAYIMLRPFFAPTARSLAADAWVLDRESSAFPGSVPAKAQELSAETHPHLQLARTLVSIPRVEPGDQVYWHCDVVHAVETEHTGAEDSSVLYIPAVPLTLKNAEYLRDQRETFGRGLPPPDFPGGEGEARFVGRVRAEDVADGEARRLFGLAPLEAPEDASAGERNLVEAANRVLFP